MANKFNIEDTWYHKAVCFHLKAGAFLGERGSRNRAPPFLLAMTTPVFIFVCQEICGIFIKLYTHEFTLDQVVIPFQHALVIGSGLFGALWYTVIFRSATLKVVEDATGMLNCYSEESNAISWGKHKGVLKFFASVFVLLLYIVWIFAIVVSPLMRHMFKMGSSSYIVISVWYPWDMMSSKNLFWVAYMYEVSVFTYTYFIYIFANATILYAMLHMTVQFDMLGCFFMDAPLDGDNQQNHSVGKENGDFSAPRRGSGILNISRLEHLSAENKGTNTAASLARLKKGIEDLHTLRRRTQFASDTLKVISTTCHFTGLTSVIVLAFAGANELRSSETMSGRVSRSVMYFARALAAINECFSYFYNASQLQDAHDNLRFSLRETNWTRRNKEFKKVFLISEGMLNQSVKIKAYSFMAVNLITFGEMLLTIWSYTSSLYQLSAPH